MNIAITIWGNRISPVFDASQFLLVIEVQAGVITNRKRIKISPLDFQIFLKTLKRLRVDILVCGAICKMTIHKFKENNIEIAPFITGRYERVIDRLLSGRECTDYIMPGCRGKRWCRKFNSSDKAGAPGAQQGKWRRGNSTTFAKLSEEEPW